MRGARKLQRCTAGLHFLVDDNALATCRGRSSIITVRSRLIRMTSNVALRTAKSCRENASTITKSWRFHHIRSRCVSSLGFAGSCGRRGKPSQSSCSPCGSMSLHSLRHSIPLYLQDDLDRWSERGMSASRSLGSGATASNCNARARRLGTERSGLQ
jgi:hypothetical protein